MNMPEGEVCDRYTILRMKARLDAKSAILLKQYDKEFRVIMEHAVQTGFEDVLMDRMLMLQEANSRIWMLEASMRKEFKDDPAAQEELDMAEFGKRALAIRDINKFRVKAKADIDELFGRIVESKVEHASEPSRREQNLSAHEHERCVACHARLGPDAIAGFCRSCFEVRKCPPGARTEGNDDKQG